MSTSPLYVIDEFVAKPGQAKAALDLYAKRYAPTARDRGMTLYHSWVSPPLVLEGNQSNRVTFVWMVDGIKGWWRMRHGAIGDPSIAAFWAELSPLIEERERRYYGDSDDV